MSVYRDGPAPVLRIEIEPDHRRRNRALAFLGGAAGTLAVSLLVGRVQASRSTRHSAGVDELMTASSDLRAGVRVDGDLVPGTLVRQEWPCEYRFSIEKNGFRMPVRYVSCFVSDPFSAAAESDVPTPITVYGGIEPGAFVATEVIARVPSCCFCSQEAAAAQMKAWRHAEQAQAH